MDSIFPGSMLKSFSSPGQTMASFNRTTSHKNFKPFLAREYSGLHNRLVDSGKYQEQPNYLRRQDKTNLLENIPNKEVIKQSKYRCGCSPELRMQQLQTNPHSSQISKINIPPVHEHIRQLKKQIGEEGQPNSPFCSKLKTVKSCDNLQQAKLQQLRPYQLNTVEEAEKVLRKLQVQYSRLRRLAMQSAGPCKYSVDQQHGVRFVPREVLVYKDNVTYHERQVEVIDKKIKKNFKEVLREETVPVQNLVIREELCFVDPQRPAPIVQIIQKPVQNISEVFIKNEANSTNSSQLEQVTTKNSELERKLEHSYTEIARLNQQRLNRLLKNTLLNPVTSGAYSASQTLF